MRKILLNSLALGILLYLLVMLIIQVVQSILILFNFPFFVAIGLVCLVVLGLTGVGAIFIYVWETVDAED